MTKYAIIIWDYRMRRTGILLVGKTKESCLEKVKKSDWFEEYITNHYWEDKFEKYEKDEELLNKKVKEFINTLEDDDIEDFLSDHNYVIDCYEDED